MAPEFTLPWATRDSVGPADAPFRLAHLRGKVVVLAFYPQDFTSGCTAENEKRIGVLAVLPSQKIWEVSCQLVELPPEKF